MQDGISNLSAAEFRRPTMSSFMGNMGESLDHGLGTDEDELVLEDGIDESEGIEDTTLDIGRVDEEQRSIS